MATKTIMVWNDSEGAPERLQSGDDVNVGANRITKVAAATLIAGNAVYASSDTDVNKARANADATAKCFGLAVAAASSSASVAIQVAGPITLTTGQWDALCGTSGGLTRGVKYFLSEATAGLLSSTPSTTAGDYIHAVIVALSPTEAVINGNWASRIKL